VADQPLAYRYRDVAIKTANPLQLIVILYDAAIHSLREAQEHLKRKDIASRARSVNRALSIISELQASLNFKEGGEIAQSLDRLYAYMKTRVFTANAEQDGDPFGEVALLLENLRSAWHDLAVQSQKIESQPVQTTPPEALLNGTAGQLAHRPLNVSG